jgi:hypothetical protein
MAKISRDSSAGTLHPRETIFSTAALASVNAEIIIPSDGSNTIALDVRGTYVGTMEVSGTVDGTNWIPIMIRGVNIASRLYVPTITTVAGAWLGAIKGYKSVRVRMTAYTSGSATVYLAASTGFTDLSLDELVTSVVGTATGAAAAAVTLTLAAPGAGLRHYITYLRIGRLASALLVGAATPVIVTTTNIPGALAFSIPASADAIGVGFFYQEDYAYPLATSAQNTATTIVCPATTSTIWRVTAGYYVAA